MCGGARYKTTLGLEVHGKQSKSIFGKQYEGTHTAMVGKLNTHYFSTLAINSS
jgi:hypothetical protein